jgi:hypothetical protein
LGLATTFGHGLGEVRKDNGKPKPKGDLQAKTERSNMMQAVANELNRSEESTDFDNEHDGILDHRPRMQFAKRIDGGGPEDLRIR